MSVSNNRSIRIRTNVNSTSEEDKYVNLKLENDIDIIELLSLKIDTTNFYKMHTSNYGCVAGRVLANGGVGIPNAKISAFIALEDSETDDDIITSIYPYSYVYGKNDDGVRYNLLPEEQVAECHTPVGTFPSKRMVLDDDNVIEVFDKYYKYTTRTNDAGDYMIFGLPVGNQTIHVDIDLSDIGMLSQHPRDMVYKGYNITQFENANKFKSDTNLDNLTQIITQNQSVYVYPFWGDTDENEIKITRNDIDIQYKFEPTCIFLGSLITDNRSEGVSKDCVPTERMGKMDKITTGSGTIEMIRKTPDGGVEEKQIQGNQLIDGNGTWCYQIPMNLDYYMTDEYGNFVPSDDKEKGIPTRTRVRFRVSLTDFQSDYENNHLAKVLVPNNPHAKSEVDYSFGSATLDDDEASLSYRDLFWNKIYSVKQYIPRIQKGNNQRNKKFSGIKNINVNGGNNPIPYNNMRVNLTFMFILQCAIIKIIIIVTGVVNWIGQNVSSQDTCSALGDGVCPELENWYFAPRCKEKHLSSTAESITNEESDDKQSTDYENRESSRASNFCVTNQTDYLMQCIEIALAMEYEVIQFDFYNDWMNGMLYVPRWFVNYRKKRSYLFGLIRVSPKIEACKEDTFFKERRYTQQCALEYSIDSDGNYTKLKSPLGCKNNSQQVCHKGSGRKSITIFKDGGIVHTETTLQNQSVYYFKPVEWKVNNKRCILFATDIILLGSMDDCDKDGVPKIFTELTSSTYIMPSNLASTNMDNQSFMYGWSDKGTRCTGSDNYRTEALQKVEQTFENYQQWIKNTDDYEAVIDDVDEYPITEASGIDWGYNGPGQGDNDEDKLYYPGGHFLGISCFNSQVNVKSCVNLARICEIGSIMSQRQAFVRYVGGTAGYETSYLVPNGLISRLEITDSDFRREFATLNYNNLRTKIDPETQYRKYDFKYIHPTNFNGELNSKIDQTSAPYYKNRKDDENGRTDSTASAYHLAVEESSADYYYFRFGLSQYEDKSYLDTIKKSKFLYSYASNGSAVLSMPMYENSYYFYFGLKDGSTAIDRFFTDFYAQCETEDEDQSYYTVTVNDGEDVCSLNGVTASVSINDVDSPYTVSLTKLTGVVSKYVYLKLNDSYDGTIDTSTSEIDGYKTTVTHNFSNFTLAGLSSGSYTLRMTAKDYNEVQYTFTVDETLSTQLSNIEVNAIDFTTTSYNETSNYNRTNPSNGYIEFKGVYPDTVYGFLIATDEKYVLYKLSELFTTSVFNNYIDLSNLTKLDNSKVIVSTNSSDSTAKDYKIPAWRGNDTYYTYMVYPCGTNVRVLKLDDVLMSMPVSSDIYFGDTDFSYRIGVALSGSTFFNDPSWPLTVINDTGGTYTEKQKWNVKQSLFYKNSLYNSTNSGHLSIIPSGTTLEGLKGNAEMRVIEETGDDIYSVILSVTENQVTSAQTPEGYTMSIDSFALPTSYFSSAGSLAVYSASTISYNKSGWANTNNYDYTNLPSNTKFPYLINMGGGMRVPSIYRPCYITAVMLVNEVYNMKYYVAAINNIITYNNKVNSLSFNGNKITNDSELTFGEMYYGDYTQVRSVVETASNGTYSNGDESFSVNVEEGSPSSNYTGDLSPSSYACSSSCHFPCNEVDDDFYYTDGIKFYYCVRNERTVAVDSNTVTEGANNVQISQNSTIVINNVGDGDIVKIHFKEINTDTKGIITNLGTVDLLEDTSASSEGRFNAEGKTVMNTVSLETTDDGSVDSYDNSSTFIYDNDSSYRYAIFELNSLDKLSIATNIEYTVFTVNHSGVIRIKQTTVAATDAEVEEADGAIIATADIKVKTITPSVAGYAVICWKPVDTGQAIERTMKVTYSPNGKYTCGISNNTTITIASAKWLEGVNLYLDYIEVNDTVVLACRINGTQTTTSNTEGDETLNYVSKIMYERVPKDYSNKYTGYWNGIFGNAEYSVIDVSSQLTIAAITAKAASFTGTNRMWTAFKSIIANDIKQDVFAVYDEWTRMTTYTRTNSDGETVTYDTYSNDHSTIWNHRYPDTNSIALVKYFPKNI